MKVKRLLALLMSSCMLFSIVGCGQNGAKETGEKQEAEDKAADDAAEDAADDTADDTAGADTDAEEQAKAPEGDGAPVEINYATFMVGSHLSAKAEAKVIEEFNEQYAGRIQVNIEELPSDSAYVDKMKTLAASKDLPDVVMGKEGIRELAVKNGQAVDLMPLLEEDADWKAEVGDAAIEYNKDGDALYSIANAKQTIGYFYNKEMFEAAGIEPAATWDEFMDNNEKLVAAGYTPLALMTGENCWTTNLWLAAMIGTDGDEGNAFMNTFHPDSYENDSVIKGLEMIQTCLQK